MPYEILNKKFRAAQKFLDREVALITSVSNELTACVSKPSVTVDEVSGLLDGISKKLTNMKRKVVCKEAHFFKRLTLPFPPPPPPPPPLPSHFKKLKAAECLDEEMESTKLCKARLDHLKSYASGEQMEVQKNIWRKARVDRMLVDHFLREGHYAAAIKLAESSKLEVVRVVVT